MDVRESSLQAARWLKKANAKAVFATLFVTLICVSGLWTFSLMTEVKNPTIAPSSRSGGKQNLPLGVIAMADAALKTVADNFPSVSPFAGAPARPRRAHVANPDERPKRDFSSLLDRLKNRKKPDRDHPARIDRPETVRLVYKGIFKRSDGVKMALIQDSKSEGSSFYHIDSDVFGVTLKDISPETIEVMQEDGSALTLERNSPTVFVEGKHVP